MKVCLITPGQPSTNPRLVKEADALVEAGYEVHVLFAHWVSWADRADERLLASRSWTYRHVGGHPDADRFHYWGTRLRHRLALRGLERWPGKALLRRWSLCRVTPELEKAALVTPADLYVAHYPGALAAAATAAEQHGACLGYDAEDFYSGASTDLSPVQQAIEVLERRLLPRCDYVTAASPGIAEAYVERYGVRRPATILNVFPLCQRAAAIRPASGDGSLTLYWFSQTIGAQRGLEDVVEAMGLLGEPEVRLHLRGKWQPGYRDRLLRFAAENGVRPEQIVAHPPAPADEMVRLAAEHDVGLALEPGRDVNNQLTISNKLFTYLLAGNAVIATATDGQRALMEAAGGAGVCYRPGDVEALAAHLRKWYEDREALEAARRRAWEWGTRRYNWDSEKQKFLRIVEDALA